MSQAVRAVLGPQDLRLLTKILESGHRLEALWPTADPLRGPTLIELIDLIARLPEAESEDLKRLSKHARDLTPEMGARHLAGILVPFERLHGKSLRDDQFLVSEGDRSEVEYSSAPLRIIADNLRSAFNVGAILRTAECFAVEEVILTGYTPTPNDEKTAKTSLGAQDSVKWSSADHLKIALKAAVDDGYTVVALETVASADDLSSFEWPEKSVLLLGNERFGLDDEAMKQASRFVRIPLFGRKNSLNVGIACGIALADWRSKLERKISEPTTRTYRPIGTFHSNATHRYEARRQASVDASEQDAVIRLDAKSFGAQGGQNFEQALKDLEGFGRIWIIYDFHHNQNWKSLIRPPRGSHEKRGVFATRAPYRPNPIGLSCVELISVNSHGANGPEIVIRGHDMLDGTPVLDIKPYIPYADSFPESHIGWLEGVEDSRVPVIFSEAALAQLQWLEEKGVDQLRGFLTSQLEFDATDSDRKRVTENETGYRIAYRTWRADFHVSDSGILIESLSSGYSNEDLLTSHAGYHDRYNDKILHREFLLKYPKIL